MCPLVVIGHGRVTGPAASVQAGRFSGRRIHFFHVASEEIEWFKEDEDNAARKGEERTRRDVELAEKAALAVAVGRRLARVFGTELHPKGVKVHAFEPGPLDIRSSPANLPPGIQVLVLGRSEDYELKGLDIAAQAFSSLDTTILESPPTLLIRGAPAGKSQDLRRRLHASSPGLRQLKIREYTSNPERIQDDLLSSSLVLMPSRAEGFGLVGLEAISAEVPVLVSSESGLAELLRTHVPEMAKHQVIEVVDDPVQDRQRWCEAMMFVLQDRRAAFQRAKDLRTALASKLSWDSEVKKLVDALLTTVPPAEIKEP